MASSSSSRRSLRIERDKVFAADMEKAVKASLGEDTPLPNPLPAPTEALPVAQVEVEAKIDAASGDKSMPVGVVVAVDKSSEPNIPMPPVAPAGAAGQAPHTGDGSRTDTCR